MAQSTLQSTLQSITSKMGRHIGQRRKRAGVQISIIVTKQICLSRSAKYHDHNASQTALAHSTLGVPRHRWRIDIVHVAAKRRLLGEHEDDNEQHVHVVGFEGVLLVKQLQQWKQQGVQV